MSDDMYDERLAALEARLSALDAVEPRAAPLGFFQVAPGESILSDHMNTAILQGVPPFASAAARAAAIPTPAVGMLSYLSDVARYERYVGGAWRPEIRAWGTGSVLAGSAPPSNDLGAVIQFGSVIVTPNVNGKAGLNFPKAFPTCVQSVIATLGSSDPRQIAVSDTDYALAGCAVTFYTAAGALAPNGSAVRVNWIALGF